MLCEVRTSKIMGTPPKKSSLPKTVEAGALKCTVDMKSSL